MQNDIVQKITDIQAKARNLQTTKDKAQAILDLRWKEAKEKFGCETIEQIDNKINELTDQIAELEEKLEEMIEKFEARYKEAIQEATDD